MEAIILAGGQGTRLRSVVADCPKPMAPVGGRPFLEILLGRLIQQGIDRCILSLGYQAQMIRRHFGASFAGVELVYHIEDTPLGTGGAIRQCLKLVAQDHALILNGDTYLEFDLRQLASLWQAQHLPIIVARAVADTARYGRMTLCHNRVMAFAEKGVAGKGYINAGVYVFPVDLLNDYAGGRKFSIESDYLQYAVKTTPFLAYTTQGVFIDIGTPEDYARAQSEFLRINLVSH